MAYEVLKHYSDRTLSFLFVSNVDSTDFVEATRESSTRQKRCSSSRPRPSRTLETMTNARKCT